MTGTPRTSGQIPANTPCLIGTARRTWRTPEADREPLDLWSEVVGDALADAAEGSSVTSDRIRATIDDLGLVHCQSWRYDDPAERAAERLGLGPGSRTESILAGTSPQRLLDSAAVRLREGSSVAALVVGGEALATRRALAKQGRPPAWSHSVADPSDLPIDLDEWYLPTEIAHGVLPAWLTFALLEQGRWAARGATATDREQMAITMSRLTEVAATNADAWFSQHRTAAQIAADTPGNRLVATPYRKLMTAFLDVDMAAANLMVTHGLADEWGVPMERRVYLRGWGFARDAVHIAARSTMSGSPAMRVATATALRRSGLSLADVDLFDLYSCFPSAVEFAQDAIGLDPQDPRPLTVTGGLACHGGPGSNYMGHSISHAVEAIRSDGAAHVLVTGVGMHMTKHVAAVWSSRPGGDLGDDAPQRWTAPTTDDNERSVAAGATGPVEVLAACVVNDSPEAPSRVVAVCELEDGQRCYATSSDHATVAAVQDGSWAGAAASVAAEGGVNLFHL